MIGQTISHFKIVEKIGEGGMGVVYKAEDANLHRFVALKFLPQHLSASADDKARFIQEAQAASALNHPNVCTIHDIQEHEGRMFIVMEFVEGQTLRDMERSDQGSALPLKRAVDIGIQIADGLAAAHEKGIVHRDIKPDNIMIRRDGIVQIMDFGLAKLKGVSKLTKEGSTIGTAGYMSPEQVQGLETDHRSDIFSYGVLMYELFTRQLPFRGVHETALAYEIVNVDPLPMSSVRQEIDPALDAIVLECLPKEPSERFQSIAEAAKDLRRYKRESTKKHLSRSFPAQPGLRQPSSAPESEAVVATPRRSLFPWGIAALLFIAMLVVLLRQVTATREPQTLVTASIAIPDSLYMHSYGQGAGPPQISPDGKNIVFLGVTASGNVQLYVRSLRDNTVRALEGTNDAEYPFWSPDGRYVGYFAGGKVKKVDIGGGSPITVCNAPNPRGGTWSSAGVILFTPEFQSPIFRVSADGGAVEPITRVDSSRNESSHRWPFALPDGKHFLYFSRKSTVSGEAEGHAVFASSIDGKENRMVLHSASNATYAAGYLFYVRGSTLTAQRFDQSTLTLSGEPVPVADDVMDDPGFNLSVFSASETGLLIYQQGKARAGAKLLLTDRTGKTISTLGESIEHFRVRYSPDGQNITTSIFDPKLLRLNIWMYNLRTGAKNRITSGMGEDYPLFSPDNASIVYTEQNGSAWNLHRKQVNSQSPATGLLTSPYRDFPLDWMKDGSAIVFQRVDASRTNSDLWMLQMSGGHDAYPLLNSNFEEESARFSPDGRWLAYVSNESGEFEVYIRPAAKSAKQTWKISAGGGGVPRWAGSSSELCYITTEGKMMLATLRFRNDAVEVAGTHFLYTVPAFLESYDISPDGKTFVINRSLEMQKLPPLTLLVNWSDALKEHH